MKILVLLSLICAVALGMPAPPPGVPQSPVLPKEEQSPLLGDSVPAQGHVEVENPAPQPRLSSTEALEVQPDVKVEVKAEPEVKVELKAGPEVKVEVKAEPEVKGEEAGIEVKVKSEDKVEEKSEAGQVQVEPETKVEPELKAEPEVEVEPEAQVKPEDVVEEKFEAGQEVQVEPEVQAEPEAEPDLRVESDVQVQPPLLDEAQLQEQVNLDRQTDPLLSVQERHIDMEGKYEMQGDEFEQLDEDVMPDNTELSEVEKSMRAAFQNPNLAVEPQPEMEEEEGPARMRDYVPVEEVEPKMIEEPFGNQYVKPEEEQQLDMMEPQMLLSENYYPNEEARMGVKPDGSVMEEVGGEFIREEDQPVFDEQTDGAGRRFSPDPERQGLSYCLGVVFEGKCYEFFSVPKRFADAEFFCQKQFLGGHLASITSPRIHRDVMDLMLRKIGRYTRTWVGGLRFLDTNRFVWLDGSFWDYSDWLNGEPNNTANVEECLEVLAFGNGKFNDFTCWEPQAFICSYPYE